MKPKHAFVLAALCFLLALTACQSSPEPAAPAPAVTEPEDPAPEPSPAPDAALSQRERDWMEDIEYLRTEYKERHADPFCLVPEEEFDWKLDRLKAKIGTLSDNDIFFEINAVIAGMGDIHTSVDPPERLYEQRFPVRACYFDGKLYLTAYKEGYEELAPYLLHEIVAVNGVDIAFINKKVDTISSSFNSWANQAVFPNYYFLPAFFDWAGCGYTEGYTFQILNDNGEVDDVGIPVSSGLELSEWVYLETWDELLYQKGGIWTKYVDGENGGLVYLSLDNIPIKSPSTMRRYAKEIGDLFEEHPECRKLAVDLRRCPGGDASSLSGFQESIELLDAERVYVLTGGQTASAATVFMAFFKEELGAVFAGEPTAQFPSFFHLSSSALGPAVLPHSQIAIQIADSWWDGGSGWYGEYCDEDGKLYPWENTVLPDVYISQDIEDIRRGKDSVLGWVLRQ